MIIRMNSAILATLLLLTIASGMGFAQPEDTVSKELGTNNEYEETSSGTAPATTSTTDTEKEVPSELLGQYLWKAGANLKLGREVSEEYIDRGMQSMGKRAESAARILDRGVEQSLEREEPYLAEAAAYGSVAEVGCGVLGCLWGRTVGSFKFLHQVGKAGEQLIGASTMLSVQRAPLMEKAGQSLKTHRTLGYWRNGLFWGGLIMAGVGLGSENKELAAGGGLATGAGVILGFVAPYYAGSAGKSLVGISRAFPSDTQNKLMERAGKSLQTNMKLTYWGWGLIGLGAGLVATGGEDTATVGVIGLLAGLILSEFVAPMSIESAGQRLMELGNLILQPKR